MPANLDLDGAWTIQFAAIDPSTGDDVSGVTFSEASLIVNQVSDGAAGELAVGPFKLIPLSEL